MNNLPNIPPFEAGANPSESWRFWKQDFEDYVEALRYGKEPEKTKTALFRHVCGDELKKQFRAFDLKPEGNAVEVTLRQILNEFDVFFKDYQNEIYASFKFLEMKQEKGEKFADYYSRLKSSVMECNYGEMSERMLRDKIIQGLLDKPLQERLIRETSRKAKSLQEVTSECKTAEHSKAQASEMNENSIATVDAIKRNKSKIVTTRGKQNTVQNGSVKEFLCKYCGKIHKPRKCPAYGTICKNCQLKNHWAKVCRSKVKVTARNQQSSRVNAVEQIADHNDSEFVFLEELKSIEALNKKNSEKTWFQKIAVNGNEVLFKLDTGAQVNVIPKSELLKWKQKPIVCKTDQPVLDYSDNLVPILGECFMFCNTDKAKEKLKFVVTTLDSSPILGLNACEKLGLIKRLYHVNVPSSYSKATETPESVIQEFSDVFTGVGRLNRKVKIKLKENCIPHVAAPRKIPLALHEKVKLELQNMLDTGIITKVEEPTEWVNSIVVVNTPKKLRICLDPRPLNEAIQRPHYPIPSSDRLLTQLQGCKVFTILDAKNGFWQLPLDQDSSLLTTFTTPWGRFRYLVLPFGLNNSPEEFQRTMDDIFSSEQAVNPYFDDIALGSTSIEEHCKLLRRTLTLARKANLKFNIDKTQLALSKVTYLGHVMSGKGIEPDPQKVKAINNFAVPKNREDLQRFLGMVTYLSKFVSSLSNLTHSLRQLLKQDTQWLWDENTQRDFEIIKKTIVQAPCLQYFDDTKPVIVSVDASKYGMGAVLLQDSQPVAFGSVSLTEAQQRYAQIEKELLAIIYGLEHFNYYTYGRAVVVETDHKPLLGLSKKNYDTISPRLQRMLLRLNRYDATLVYVPGKQLLIADALSRAQLTDAVYDEDTDQEVSVKISLLVTASSTKWKEYSKLTSSDSELQDVLYHIKNGWPEKNKTRNAAQPYWHCKDELYCTKDGVLCRGQRLIVPSSAREEVLQKLHVSHRGIVACKSKAREYFYWPTINKDVEVFVGKCQICQKYQRANQKETLIEQDLPQRPWQKVACDFLELKGRHFLLMIDYFSKYIEVHLMNSTTAQAVITAMKSIFARHGIPEELVSDGGPPFNSEAMRRFFKDWTVIHSITSPHFPRANGQVERAVQTLKNALIKAEQDGKDLYVVLLDYRIQPSNDLPSPAELLMGRRLRSFLPSHPKRLQPNFSIKEARISLKKRQEIQGKYGNRHAKKHLELSTNTKVWFRKQIKEPWKQGTIIQVGPQPRSYLIRDKDSTIYRRNRFYIRPDTSRPTNNPGIENTRTVEDLYYTPSHGNNSVSRNSTREESANLPNKTLETNNNVRKSTRTVKKPERYCDT